MTEEQLVKLMDSFTQKGGIFFMPRFDGDTPVFVTEETDLTPAPEMDNKGE